MKRSVLLIAFAGLTIAGMQSCKKEEAHKAPIEQTINAELKINEAYTFVLPKNKRDDEYQITSPASHASVSALGKDASGNRIYQYTPALNYTGNDQVVLSNAEESRNGSSQQQGEEHPQCGHPHHDAHPGDCDKGEEDHYIVTINFVVNDPVSDKSK